MPDPNRQPDDYERRYMSADGDVLFRDRAMVPNAFLGFLAGLAGLTVASAIAVPETWPVAVLGVPTLAMTGLTMMALRTSVTSDVVHIQYGLLGPKIPIDAIESCVAVRYAFWKVGGWGVRRSLDGAWVYNMMGDGQRAAEIVYRDGTRTKKVLVSVKDLDGFVAAVHAAKARRGQGLEATRAALGVADAPTVDAVAEVTVDATAEARRR